MSVRIIIMIELDISILEKCKATYFKEISLILDKKYTANKLKMYFANPFTLGRLGSLLYNWESEFIRDLITKPINHNRTKYKELENYYKSASIVFYGKFKINDEIARIGWQKNNQSRQRFRQEFINKYFNDWIAPIISRHRNYYSTNATFKDFINEIEIKLTQLNKSISNFINYDFLSGELRHKLLVDMDIPVCPYCNRQYITSYFDGNQNKTTADLDHFLPKSHFALFSLSLYNFVPACQICNSRFKSDKGVEIINPYQKGFNAKFQVKLRNDSEIISITGGNTIFDLDLVITERDPNNQILIENTINLFHLNDIYQIHKNSVREILYKKNARAKTYKKEIKKLFEQDLKLTENEINIFLYGNDLNPDNFTNRPLSKLTYDVLKDK